MTTKLLTPDELKNGFVISKPGTYQLTGPATFEFQDGALIPERCLDDTLGIPIFGLRVEAQGVTLDLNGYSLRQSSWSALRHREFTCLGVTTTSGQKEGGPGVTIQNGTIGSSSHSCIWCSAGPLALKGLVLADYERMGVSCEAMHGEPALSMVDCIVGRPSSSKRPSPETSLALRYRPALVASGKYPQHLATLDGLATASSEDSIRTHEGGVQAGVSFAAADNRSATVVISNLVVLELTLKIPSGITFLSADGTTAGIPKGPAEDPVSESGASDFRRSLQALPLGLNYGSSNNPTLEVVQLSQRLEASKRTRGCTATAPNMPSCSSRHRTPVTTTPVETISRLRNLDQTLHPIINAIAVAIRGATSYVLTGLSLKTPTVKRERMGSRPGVLLVLDGCGQGVLNESEGVKATLVRGTPRPAGGDSTNCEMAASECSYNAAWYAGLPGGSTLSARPVGNVQNVQVVPAFLPYIPCNASS